MTKTEALADLREVWEVLKSSDFLCAENAGDARIIERVERNLKTLEQ